MLFFGSERVGGRFVPDISLAVPVADKGVGLQGFGIDAVLERRSGR